LLQAKNVEIDPHDLIVFEVLIVHAVLLPRSVPPLGTARAGKANTRLLEAIDTFDFSKGAIPVGCETRFHDYGVNCAAHRLNQSGRESGGMGKRGVTNPPR